LARKKKGKKGNRQLSHQEEEWTPASALQKGKEKKHEKTKTKSWWVPSFSHQDDRGGKGKVEKKFLTPWAVLIHRFEEGEGGKIGRSIRFDARREKRARD